jgi:uncharacterized SAM-dependent methyltransferase
MVENGGQASRLLKMLGENPCFPMLLPVQIHSSAHPSEHRKILHRSLETRSIHPRLLYESAEQVRKWFVVHHKYAPIGRNAAALDIYKKAAVHITQIRDKASFQIISLGCGDGRKDMLFLEELQTARHSMHYIPCDISLNLVLEAQANPASLSRLFECSPIVCDVKHNTDLAEFLKPIRFPDICRIFLFFGLLPNMETTDALECLRVLLKPNDRLLVGTNLSPQADYEKGIVEVLPQYDNEETREWLLTLVHELGIPSTAGKIRFEIREAPSQKNLKRIEAIYRFETRAQVTVDGKIFKFDKGDEISLFFSNRHTSAFMDEFLDQLHVAESSKWLNSSQDEVVFAGKVQLS